MAIKLGDTIEARDCFMMNTHPVTVVNFMMLKDAVGLLVTKNDRYSYAHVGHVFVNGELCEQVRTTSWHATVDALLAYWNSPVLKVL